MARRTKPVRTISIPPDIITRFVQPSFPEFFPKVLPKGTWGSAEEVTTLGYNLAIYARQDVDEGLVYTMLKSIYPNYDTYSKVHPVLQEWTLKNALRSMGLPLHPGAIRYYKEQGIWTQELEDNQQVLVDWAKTLEARVKK